MSNRVRVQLFAAEYWDQDKEGAIDRAKETNNMVIWSASPEADRMGYWVDETDTMIRTYERVIYPT